MIKFTPGDSVLHSEYGPGRVVQVLGGTAVVSFFGEDLDVSIDSISLIRHAASPVVDKTGEAPSMDMVAFHRTFEAINLGVVPPDHKQLIELTIRSDELKDKVSGWFSEAPYKGLCKVVFGYYGSGKSHLLKFVRCMALQAGWAVAYLEFDPKSADPAKPHLVYQNLMSNLEFPERENGDQTDGFVGFIKEVRNNWDIKNIRHNAVFKSSQWFSGAFEILMKYSHYTDDQDYLEACLWLAGDHNFYQTINRLAKEKGLRVRVPRMPVTKETADIYVFHLAVVNELCRLLGYQGLLVILDEAEHVRGYNVRRRERANNLFDMLSRAAHAPIPDDESPILNDHGIILPPYWEKGPHFSLFVGLTEADTFLDQSLDLREACVFLRTEDDKIMLSNPCRDEYKQWCDFFLKRYHGFFPLKTQLLSSQEIHDNIVDCLAESYPTLADGVTLRHFIKLASLVPCILIAHPETTLDSLKAHIRAASGNFVGHVLPWERHD